MAEAHNNLGGILQRQGRLDDAIARFRRAIALKPTLAEAHNNLGGALKDLGQLDEAAAQFERAIALRPDLAEAHNNLGGIFQKQGKLDQAQSHYEQAIALRPDLPKRTRTWPTRSPSKASSIRQRPVFSTPSRYGPTMWKPITIAPTSKSSSPAIPTWRCLNR